MNLSRIRDAALIAAKRSGHQDIAEDFAQEAMLKISQGRKASIAQILIDYLRSTYGKTEHGTNSYMEQRNYGPLDINQSAQDQATLTPTESELDFFNLLRRLDKEDKAYIILRYKFDLELKELGQVFGVSESRAYQRLKEIEAALYKHLKNQGVN